tara:strand:+ start:712 stop:930 length:219 start_codon:yes stop_codon:yes gene_type:complete
MEFSIGDKVKIASPVSYLKTAEPMPMLRPPDLVATDEVGQIIGLDSLDLLKIKFRRGTFLLPRDKVLRIDPE